MPSIWNRPVDLFFVAVFTCFAVIDLVQSTYGAVLEVEQLEYGVWPPRAVVDVYVWWCQNYDKLLGHNPVWFETLAWVSTFVYTLFYFVAIYAFLYQKEWIRIPALMWAWGLLLTLLACMREEIEGPYKTDNVPVIVAAYGAYIVVPVLVMIRMAWSPVFSSSNNKKKTS